MAFATIGETSCVDIALLRCTGGYYVQVLLITFFLFSSDVFIMLRYVVLSKAVYLTG